MKMSIRESIILYRKKLNEIDAKEVLKSQKAVDSTTPVVELCDEIINAIPQCYRELVDLLITPFSIEDSAYHGVNLDTRLRHL